jgi:hypothetical protein
VFFGLQVGDLADVVTARNVSHVQCRVLRFLVCCDSR